MSVPLPAQPNLRYLRTRAKKLLKLHRNKDPDACAILRLLRRFSVSSPEQILSADIALSDVQYAMALQYGFESWKKLAAFVESCSSVSTGPRGELQIPVDSSCKIAFVPIPAGVFYMGSENGGEEERPVHLVTIAKPFYMGKYAVTQEQWQKIMGTTPSRFEGALNPVEQITWDKCQVFLSKLTDASPGKTFRFPTEAQWEYACRAGTKTAYSFGDSPDAIEGYAWVGSNSESRTHPVGEKKPNAWGLHDMHGNVWEWVQDRDHFNYSGCPVDGSAWTDSGGSFHVVRGGSWDDVPKFCRSSSRPALWPAPESMRYGFRVMCEM